MESRATISTASQAEILNQNYEAQTPVVMTLLSLLPGSLE